MSFKYKTKEELKEYLDNLGIEYRYGCFSEKNPEVCHLLGEYLDLIKSDYQKAARIYKTNCDDFNYGRSCHAYGNYVLTGKGSEKQSFEMAYTYYQKACDLDISNSCFNAGIITIKGDSNAKREKDYTKGVALLDKGCSLLSMNACYYLSGLYIGGSGDNQIEKDMKKAFKYSEKACELGSIHACANLSIMYRKGEGVEKDEQKSKKYKSMVEQMRAEMEVNRLEDDGSLF